MESDIRVLIADDDPLAGEAIRIYLEQAGMLVLGRADTGREAVRLTNELKPDVVLLDITMPDLDGLEALATIKMIRPQTSVIMLTAHKKPELLAQALISGAGAYLTKQEVDLKQLPDTIRTVAEGDQAVVEQRLLQEALDVEKQAANHKENLSESGVASLTRQESRVLKLIAEGLNNAEIAGRLFISENTIKTHVGNIFAKLNVSDRTQAVILAFRLGLVE